MRAAALTLIIICEIFIGISLNLEIDASSLSFLTTLIIVVVSAFASSALLRNIKSLNLTKNYGISSVIGVVLGILYYMWIADHVQDMVDWILAYGKYILLLIILVCAFVLYFDRAVKVKEVHITDEAPSDSLD